MSPNIDPSELRFPEWLFEQDYMVFLSFFGWAVLGLLAWTKPLCDRQKDETLWIWFGYFAFAEATADFVRTLSFSDPFFRTFTIEIPLEMLGLGCLIEGALRGSKRFEGKSFPSVIAISCGLLGFAIEVGSMLYSLLVAFAVSTVACVWFALSVRKIALEKGRHELYIVFVGILLLVPAWVLHPDHIAFLRNETLVTYSEFPFYGFLLLFLRIVSAWLVLGGFWIYRLRARIEDVGEFAQEKLKVLGYRVLPGTLIAIILASYLVTTWNGRRESGRMEVDFLSRSRTAALSIDDEAVKAALNSGEREGQALQKSLKKIREIGKEVDQVYVWDAHDSQIRVSFSESGENLGSVVERSLGQLDRTRKYEAGESFLIRPIKLGQNLVLNASSPILDTENGSILAWLGIDMKASDWMKNISLARLQTIIIAGLVLALVIFFLYYQIESESETDLALAKERAESADRAKSEFLAVISHEIRTPLQSVLGYSNLLRATKLDENQLACLDTIQSEGKILLRIVQDILDFSNLRKANSSLKEDSVHLKSLIQETYRTIRPMAEKKGLIAELVIDETLPAVVKADSVRLRQVLLNLYGNSVKYTNTGSVRLTIRNRSPGMSNGSMDFVISDTGVGIKREDLDRLFEPFIQLEHVGSSPREGAGLGLAIVKRIVELMKGTISVTSEFGKGSSFTASFDFKVLEQKESDGMESTDLSDLDSGEQELLGERYPLKTLVADDNPMVRRLIVQYLVSLGYAPDQVEDGKPASEVGAAYDLIITDLRMPGMDGPSAAAIVREKSGLDDQPWIIGVSATLAEAEIERAMQSGINDFMGKPFFEEDLEKRIRAIPWLERLASDPEEQGEEGAPIEENSSTAFASRGMGLFSEEMIREALEEVNLLCEKMASAASGGDFEFIKETAHYVSNTAMAIGLEQLYIDCKALQKAAEDESPNCSEALAQLKENFTNRDRPQSG